MLPITVLIKFCIEGETEATIRSICQSLPNFEIDVNPNFRKGFHANNGRAKEEGGNELGELRL